MRHSSKTCIIAIKNKKGKLMFAGDRRVSLGDNRIQRLTEPKVIKRDGLLIGGSGDGYICDLMCKSLVIPEVYEKVDSYTFVTDVLFKSITELLVSKHLYNVETGQMTHDDVFSIIIIAHRGHLFDIYLDSESGISISESATPHAIGCGASYALGSLLTTQDTTVSDKKRLQVAIQVAAELSPGCDSECDIIEED